LIYIFFWVNFENWQLDIHHNLRVSSTQETVKNSFDLEIFEEKKYVFKIDISFKKTISLLSFFSYYEY
jgi:hypothetical protein